MIDIRKENVPVQKNNWIKSAEDRIAVDLSGIDLEILIKKIDGFRNDLAQAISWCNHIDIYAPKDSKNYHDIAPKKIKEIIEKEHVQLLEVLETLREKRGKWYR